MADPGGLRFTSVAAPTRAEQLVRQIEQHIRSAELQPGNRLGTREDIRGLTGAARATVNEAVRLLSDRGLIDARPGAGGGIFVAEPPPSVQLGRMLLLVGDTGSRIEDVIALRDHLESMVLEEAARHRTLSDLEALDAIVEQIDANRYDPDLFVSTIWSLHERIVEITPNQVLKMTYLALLASIRDETASIARSAEADGEYLATRVRAHADLVDVVRSGDVSRVAKAIANHQN